MIIEDFKPYVNKYGMVPYTNPPGITCQNDTLFTTYYLMAVLDHVGAIDEEEKVRLRRAFFTYQDIDGHTVRFPGSTEVESNDNIIGIGLAAIYIDCSLLADCLLNFANRNFWFFPGHDAWYKRWLGRYPGTKAHLELCAGRRVGILSSIFWALTVYIAANRKYEPDNYSLTYCLCEAVRLKWKKAPWLMRKMVGYWEKKRPQISMKQNLINYGWADSPHVKYMDR